MATYYFADNASPYAQPGAIQGNDAYNGLHPTFIGGSNGPKRNPANFNMDNLNAGDNVLFAQGGGWDTSFIAFIENPATTSRSWSNPITFGSYNAVPGLTQRPYFHTSSMGFLLGGYGQTGAISAGGFVFSHLKIEGAYGSADDAGIVINPPRSHIVIVDCEIKGFQCDINVRFEAGGQSAYIYIHRNDLSYGRLGAIVGSAQDMTIENNDCHDNGNRHNLTHTMYLGASANVTRRMIVRGNHIYRSNIDTDGTSGQVGTFPGCAVGGHLTFRGQLHDACIEDNLIENTGGKFNINCYGISHFPGYDAAEFHHWTKIRRNHTMGMQSHIPFGSCPNIEVRDNVMTDNGVVGESPAATAVGWPANTSYGSNDSTHDDAAQIINNRFVSTDPRTGTRFLNTDAGVDNSPGDNVRIDGNTAIFGANASSDVRMFDLTETDTTYVSISNNRKVGGDGWATGYASLAAFEAHYGALVGTVCTGNTEEPEG